MKALRWTAICAVTLIGGCENRDGTDDAATGDIDAHVVVTPDATTTTPDDAGVDAHSAPDDTGTDAHVEADAGPRDAGPEPCTSEGMFRRVGCVCGGMQSERCVSGSWSVIAACDRELVCAPGTFETRDVSRCGVQQRECPDGCGWTAWTDVVPRGPCDPASPPLCEPPATNCVCQSGCTCVPHPECPYPLESP